MKKNISVIIPFFNERYEIPYLVNDIFKFEKKYPKAIFEYLFINDCSTDNSSGLLRKLLKTKKIFKKKVRIIENIRNIGWANSLKKGYKICKGNYCLYIPGDGEARLTKFMNYNIINERFDILLIQRKAMKGRPLTRRFISYLYRNILSILSFPTFTSVFVDIPFDNTSLTLLNSFARPHTLFKKINLLKMPLNSLEKLITAPFLLEL